MWTWPCSHPVDEIAHCGVCAHAAQVAFDLYVLELPLSLSDDHVLRGVGELSAAVGCSQPYSLC